MVNNNIIGDGGHDWSGTLKAIDEATRCTSCEGRGYHPRQLECNFPKPSVMTVKVKCGVCWGTGRKAIKR